MSRTNRKHISESNHREARKGRANARAAWAASPGFARHNAHGGMMLSSRNTGYWADESVDRGVIRAREHRSAQATASDVLFTSDEDAVDNIFIDS